MRKECGSMQKEKIVIIAEAGVNHNGSLELAKELVTAAKECGADIVKFQTAKLDALVSRHAQMAEYQMKHTGMVTSQKEMLERLLLPYEDFTELAGYCKKTGIRFLSTPFDTESIAFLNPLQDIWKIPSGEITNYPYLAAAGRTGKDILLSTGMSTLEETGQAIRTLRDNGSGEVTLLHCTTEYPAPMQDVNLNAMLTLKRHFGCRVGYSDHTDGIEVPAAAAAMGASVIEKHLTLDRTMEGPDHKASLEPDSFAAMVIAVRNIEAALGTGIKAPAESEKKNMAVARKSIVARRNIKKGEILSEANLTTKRPGDGLCPMLWPKILGTRAVRDFMADDLIEWTDRMD